MTTLPLTDTAESLKKERYFVIILAAIQIVHILDFVIMMPLGPQFMRVFSITTTQFSSLVSAYTFSAGIVGFFGALYADHFDRKKFLLFNFTGFIIGTFMCAIAPSYTTLLIARVVAGAFGGVLNACVLSLVADLIPFQRRGAAMSVVMSAFSIASVVGVPVGLYVANAFSWHAPFFLICAIGIVFWIFSFFLLPSVRVRSEAMGIKENLKNFKNILGQKDYLQSFCLTSILGFGVFTIVPFISPYMVNNVGVLETQLPYLYFAGGLCTIIFARIVGKLCDRVGSYRVFKWVAVISVVPIYLLTNLPATHLWIAIIVNSLFMTMGSARFIPAMTLVSAVVKPKERGTFMSLENASRQFSSGAASQFAGFIVGKTAAGLITDFEVVGYIGIVTSILTIFIAARIKNKFNLR